MTSLIGEWLKPPVFPEDEHKTRVAHILHVILVAILGGVLVYAAITLGFIRYGIQNLAFLVPAIPLVMGLLHLTRKGYVHLSSLLFVFLAWFNLTALIISYGYGMRGASMLGYILIVIAAGLLVSGRFAIIFSLLNMFSGLTLIYLENIGIIPTWESMQADVAIWAIQVFFSLSVAMLLNLVLKSLQNAIKRASLSESCYRMLFEAAPSGILIVDEKDQIVMANEAVYQMLGYLPEEVIGRSPLDFVATNDLIHQPPELIDEFNDSEPARRERSVVHKDGMLLNVMVDSRHMSDGRLQYIIQDNTERKRMEKELRLREERYRMISAVMSDYVFSNVQNEKGEIVLNWSAGAFEQISGYSMDEFNARGGWVSTVHPDDLERDARDMEILRNNQQVVSELRTIHKDGSIRWVRSYAHPVWDSERDQLVGIYGAVQDVTEQKQAELEREHLIQELETKNAQLEQFAYTISHDLKAPIITIRGFLGFLMNDAASGNMTRLESDVQRIGEAAEKMYKLLNDLLDLSRIGRSTHTPELLSFAKLVDDICQILQVSLNDNGVEVVVKDNLPIVYGDAQRLSQVLQNLVDNAAKFMGEQSHPVIEIGQCGPIEDGFVTLYVRDNGIGIEPRYHERIFGLFNRLDPHVEGTGVGLALVKRIIESHGCRIWVQSEAGNGATFYFTLPASENLQDNLPESI